MTESTSFRRPLRLALIGSGAIGTRVAQLLNARLPRSVSIVVSCARNSNAMPVLPGSIVVTDPERLIDFDLDIVVEAAGRDAVRSWGQAALRSARELVVASTSALTDTSLLDTLIAVAEAHGSQIIIPPGALAGIDAIAAASVLPMESVVHQIVKPPAAWLGTPADAGLKLSELATRTTLFSGTAREAADRFPQNANVAVVLAFASVGLDKTRVELVADPDATGNTHVLTASGAFGKLSVRIENRPLATNAKSSEMAALSLVRIVENRVRTLVC